MIRGDMVRIHPHGDPAAVADARVMLVSANQRSLALEFEEPPPFTVPLQPKGALGRNGGNLHVIMLLSRHELDGKPWGPWVEIKGGGHYEIEEQPHA